MPLMIVLSILLPYLIVLRDPAKLIQLEGEAFLGTVVQECWKDTRLFNDKDYMDSVYMVAIRSAMKPIVTEAVMSMLLDIQYYNYT